MAATLAYIEYLNSSTSTSTPTELNFVSTVAGNADEATFPVSVGNYSQTKILKLQFNGTFTNISQIKLYKSSGDYVTGEIINYGTSSTYHTPTGGSYADTVATTAIPTSLPSTANISIGGSLAGSITTSGGTSDYVFLQSSVTIQAVAQTVNSKNLTFTWTES